MELCQKDGFLRRHCRGNVESKNTLSSRRRKSPQIRDSESKYRDDSPTSDFETESKESLNRRRPADVFQQLTGRLLLVSGLGFPRSLEYLSRVG